MGLDPKKCKVIRRAIKIEELFVCSGDSIVSATLGLLDRLKEEHPKRKTKPATN
jgi:hypothetical protein